MEYKSAKILSHGLNHTAEPDKYLLSGSVLLYCNVEKMEEKKNCCLSVWEISAVPLLRRRLCSRWWMPMPV